jgi:serine kinase of HPr protein (carbohydrate metabolism regulator)
MTAHLSSDTVHASTVAIDGRAVLISGRSGTGKSDLALRLIDRGFALVSDDQTIVRRDGDRLIATAPTTIAGKLEIRGIGIVELPAASDVPIALIVELSTELTRLPDEGSEREILGLLVPLVAVDAQTASAAAKVVLALDHRGLTF